ncbi:hypothetical protein SEVIR_9G218255v4 [Setaria viridis]
MGATRVVLAIVVLVLNVAAGSGAGEEEWYEPCSTASFHLDTHGYMSVFGTMKTWIFDHRDKDPIDLAEYENPKLTVQDLKNKPLHWFIPLLMGEGTASTNLAFRSDNLYLSGFTNQKGEWFSFQVDEDHEYVIPGSTVLGFKSNYASLVGGGPGTGHEPWEFLVDLDISRAEILSAIAVLSEYDPSTTPDHVIKLALARLTVAFMEAQRFPFIRQRMYELWENGGPGTLGWRGAKLVVHWSDISCALRIWDTRADKARWDSREAEGLKKEPPVGLGIATPEQALAEIWPILISQCTEQ